VLDESERVDSITDRAGGVVLYSYDAGGRLQNVRDGFDVAEDLPGYSYEYDGTNLTSITTSEGKRIEFEYLTNGADLEDRIHSVTQIGEGNPQYRFDYYRDADRNSKRGSDVRQPAVMATPREIPGW
jgi:hypothetical protein